jgi:hypothetical protein
VRLAPHAWGSGILFAAHRVIQVVRTSTFLLLFLANSQTRATFITLPLTARGEFAPNAAYVWLIVSCTHAFLTQQQYSWSLHVLQVLFALPLIVLDVSRASVTTKRSFAAALDPPGLTRSVGALIAGPLWIFYLYR